MPGTLISTITPNDLAINVALFNPDDETVWKWMVGNEAPDEDQISPTDGRATMQGYLYDHDLLNDAVATFVGYSWVDRSSGVPSTYMLRRSLPIVHPRWPFMRCVSCSVKGVRPNGQIAGVDNFYGTLQAPRAMPCPRYHEYRFALEFRQPNYEVRADSEVTSEWQRYLEIQPFDQDEIVTVDGGQFVYNLPSYPAFNRTPLVVNGPSIKVYVQRQGLKVIAHQIPADFVMIGSGIMPKFLAAKGKVNLTEFLGMPPDTVLLESIGEPTKVAQPVTTNKRGGLLYNVEIPMFFSYTNPDKLDAADTTHAGWQLVPPPITGGATGWVGALPKNILGGVDATGTIYPRYEFNDLLTYGGS